MFVLKRSPPWVWAGWTDDFNRPVENPIRQPWGHFGDGSPAELNNLQEMRIPSNYSSTTGGGESYEFQPFTPNFGMEWEMWWPVEGAVAQYLNMCIMENWSKVGPSFDNSVMVRFRHAPAVTADDVRIMEFDGLMSAGHELAGAHSPVPFFGNTITVKVLVDADSLCRVYINGQIICQALITPGHRPRPGRRGMNFFNNALADCWVRWIKIYDRPSIIPNPDQWISQFYDDFNRANGPVFNGWTEMGVEGQLVSGSYSMTGGANGSCAIIRDTGVTTGRQRVEAIAGGANGVNSDRDSSLVLRCNAAGTEGLALNFFSGHAYLARFSTSLNGGSVTFHDFVDTGVTVNNGDLLAFSAIGDTAWGEINGNIVIIAGNVSAVVPETNSYAGLRVERDGAYSHSWNDFRFLTT